MGDSVLEDREDTVWRMASCNHAVKSFFNEWEAFGVLRAEVKCSFNGPVDEAFRNSGGMA